MRLAHLFSILFFLCAPTGIALASEGLGDRRDPHEMGAGGLLFLTENGYREAPTLETDIKITVTGMIARTRISQRFTNPTEKWVEGVYVFPLPEDAAVDSLKMKIGERVIVGRVEERARAKATYQKAKSEGRKASLIEQERPNIFTTSLANLGPAEEVEVILTYQEEIRYDQGRFSTRFPMVVAPRYIPGQKPVSGFSGTGWATNTEAVPDAQRITPPVALPSKNALEAQAVRESDSPKAKPNHVTLSVEIDAGFRLEDVRSESHAIRVKAEPDNRYKVRLTDGSVPADSDFVLEWKPVVGSAPRAALFRETWAGEDYALVMVLPPSPETEKTVRLSKETVIVIDTSGSMGGESIQGARRAVQHALDTLRPEDAFNVIQFNSGWSALANESQPATAEAIARARQWVSRLEANGGTEMQPALKAALRPGRESRAVRQVIFITDGAVGNESALFATIQSQLGAARLYPVGIGSAPNAHFMTKAAEFGRGTFTYIGRPEEVSEKMGGLFKKLNSPVLHDLRIDWNGARAEAWPARIPDVYLGEPVIVAARLPKNAAHFTLEGRRGKEDVRLPLPLAGGSTHEGVARLWARRKVASLMNSLHDGAEVDPVSVEVARLGVEHQIVTRWSSLVAVDVTPTAPPEAEVPTRAVPSLPPKGWDLFKRFGRAPSVKAKPQAAHPRTAAAKTSPRQGGTPPHGASAAVIGQPLASAAIGRLPQGGTPAALLLSVGGALLGGAGCLRRRARLPAVQRQGEASGSGQAS